MLSVAQSFSGKIWDLHYFMDIKVDGRKYLCSSLFDPRKFSAGHEKKATHQPTYKTLYLQSLQPASVGAIVAQYYGQSLV